LQDAYFASLGASGFASSVGFSSFGVSLTSGFADGRWFSVADVRDMVKKNQLIHPELAHVIEKLYP